MNNIDIDKWREQNPSATMPLMIDTLKLTPEQYDSYVDHVYEQMEADELLEAETLEREREQERIRSAEFEAEEDAYFDEMNQEDEEVG